MEQRLRVREIGPGIFSTERYVAFDVDNQEYALLVDRLSVNETDKTLKVLVVETGLDNALIELPRETFVRGSRVWVPKSDLLAA